MATAGGSDPRATALRDAAHKLLAADYFAALGVTRTSKPDEVKKAFIETVKAWHPDRVPQGLEELRPLYGKVFARLELARATVSDPIRRMKYIEDLAKPSTAASAADVSSAEATLEYRKADAMLKKNDAAAAEVHLRRAVQLAPSNVEYQVLLVWLQAKPDLSLERLRDLVTDFTRLIALDATNEKAYFYRGQLRKRLDLMKDAMSDFTKAAELNPKNVDAVREVRLFNMRKERAAPGAEQARKEAAGESGAVGFFKKLFKR